jgi:hypothetical protein
LDCRKGCGISGKFGDNGIGAINGGEEYYTCVAYGQSNIAWVLLTQIMWERLKGITVPRAPQPGNFTYHMNAKEMMNEDLARKSGQQFLA